MTTEHRKHSGGPAGASRPGGREGNGRGARSERMALQKAEMRKSVIQAAERLILKRGFGRLTMDGLAREAQYSKATLYKYFRSKTEVVGAIFINYFDRVEERLIGIREIKIGHVEQLKLIIRAVLEMHEESRNLSQALLVDEAFMKKMGIILADDRRRAISPEDRKMLGLLQRRLRALSSYLAEFLAAAVKQGEFRATDPALTVRLLSASISGFYHHPPLMPVEAGIDEATEFIHHFFMHGLARRGGGRKGETR